MVKVYFEIFGKRLVKEITDKEYKTMTDEQIEYFVRGKLKVNKVVRVEDESLNGLPDPLKEIFGNFNNKKDK